MLTRHDDQGRNKEKKVSLGVTTQNIGVTAWKACGASSTSIASHCQQKSHQSRNSAWMWLRPRSAAAPRCSCIAAVVNQGRLAWGSGCGKLLPCATSARFSNRSGSDTGHTTQHSAGHPRAYTRIILGHAAHHLPDRRFLRSVCGTHVL